MCCTNNERDHDGCLCCINMAVCVLCVHVNTVLIGHIAVCVVLMMNVTVMDICVVLTWLCVYYVCMLILY